MINNTNRIYSTNDLAILVDKKIKGAKVSHKIPDITVLTKLFETLFYASLKTEESQYISVTTTLLSESSPDVYPPQNILKNRWSVVRFEEKLPFDVKNIVKLAKAADPWSSTLAVDFDEKGNLHIWGLIDQTVHYQSFLNYESDEGPEQPGLFQTSIEGIGNLSIIFDYELIATLKQNTLISNYLNVFDYGPIKNILVQESNKFEKKLSNSLDELLQDDEYINWNYLIKGLWKQAISRLLIKVKNFKHGGAILISNRDEGLQIKHKIEYKRLIESITDYSYNLIAYYYTLNNTIDNYIETKSDIEYNHYVDEHTFAINKKYSADELKGAVRFVSSLSCIDGLVLMNTNLIVRGFGVVVNNVNPPDFIYISRTSRINEAKLIKVSPDNFGTRHRSMFSYCMENPGAIGFVISQDGDIRCITNYNNKVILWENIKIQRHIKSHKLKSKKRIPK